MPMASRGRSNGLRGLLADDQQRHSVPWDCRGKDAGTAPQVFLTPDIAKVRAILETNLGQIDGNIAVAPAAIEEPSSDASVAEGLGPDIEVCALVETVALLAERVLVNGDGVLVHQDALVRIGH